MRSAFAKDTLRSISHSWGRFFAILIIVALGAGFYAGLRMTAPDMRHSADLYYDGTQLYDINVLSTMGLTPKQLDALEEVDGVGQVAPAYETDVMAVIGTDQYAIRVHSLDAHAAQASDTADGVNSFSDDEGYLNRPILVSGRWPTDQGECVLSAETITSSPLSIGDEVAFTEGLMDLDEVFTTTDLTIVGFVRSSYYSSCESLGVTSLGGGMIQQYLFVSEEGFNEGFPYTNAFMTVEGARGHPSSSEEYKDAVEGVRVKVADLVPSLEEGRIEQVRSEAQEELDAQRADYEREKADALAELDAAAAQLEEAKREIDEGQAELDSTAALIASSEAGLLRGESELASGRVGYDVKAGEVQAALEQARASIDAKQADLDALAGQIAYEDAELSSIRAQLGLMPPGDPRFAELKEREAHLEALIAEQTAALGQGRAAIAALDAGLAAEQAAWDAASEQTRAALEASESELATGWLGLAQAKAEWAAASQVLDEGRAEYELAKTRYEESAAEAQARFEEAEAGIADAQKAIDGLEKPDLYVLDRSKNYGARSYDSDAGRVDQIARVFPLIFFLVAALVSLTTMTRMVEEERVLIGTYKALGYSRSKIASKYLIYAFAASALGSAIGISVLTQVLPRVLMNAYAIMYDVPVGGTPIDPGIAALSALLGIGVTCFAAWAAALSSLREKPAALMLPRVPKPGKRIVLERIGFVWSRVSFSWKVTARNIFRYKKRLAMTLIGIAGCTALLLTGLGLSDAINDIIPKQFGQIYQYNLTVTLESEMSRDDEAAVEKVMGDERSVEATALAYTENVTAINPNGTNLVAQLTVPQDALEFEGFHIMRDRVTQEGIALGKDSVIVSEKLAVRLGIEEGDAITLAEQDAAGYTTDTHREFIVGGVMENYVGHFIMMDDSLYEQEMGKTPAFTTIFARATTDHEKRNEITDTLLPLEGVRTVGFNDEVIEAYETGLESVDTIVVVLIIAAAALAFVVLYNLTNINITEREREIATLKVLGFTRGEVAGYVFREMVILTLIGAALGLVLGVFMEWYVVVTAEVDAVMFGREIHPVSFLLAFVLTVAFSLIVAFFMRGKLVRIDMVESLKSVE